MYYCSASNCALCIRTGFSWVRMIFLGATYSTKSHPNTQCTVAGTTVVHVCTSNGQNIVLEFLEINLAVTPLRARSMYLEWTPGVLGQILSLYDGKPSPYIALNLVLCALEYAAGFWSNFIVNARSRAFSLRLRQGTELPSFPNPYLNCTVRIASLYSTAVQLLCCTGCPVACVPADLECCRPLEASPQRAPAPNRSLLLHGPGWVDVPCDMLSYSLLWTLKCRILVQTVSSYSPLGCETIVQTRGVIKYFNRCSVWSTHWFVRLACAVLVLCWVFDIVMALVGRGTNLEGWQGLVCLSRCLWAYAQTLETNRSRPNRVNRDCACVWAELGPWAIAGQTGARSIPPPQSAVPSYGLIDESEVERPLELQPKSELPNGPSNTSPVPSVNFRISPSLCSFTSALTAAVASGTVSSTHNPMFDCLVSYLYVCLPVCLVVCLLACLFACLPICLFACLSACLLAYLLPAASSRHTKLTVFKLTQPQLIVVHSRCSSRLLQAPAYPRGIALCH